MAEKLTSHILALEIIAFLKMEFIVLWYTGLLKKSFSFSMTSGIHDSYLKVIIILFTSVFETNSFWPPHTKFLNPLSSFLVENVIKHGFCVMHPFCVPCSTKKQITATECSRGNTAVIRRSLLVKFLVYI